MATAIAQYRRVPKAPSHRNPSNIRYRTAAYYLSSTWRLDATHNRSSTHSDKMAPFHLPWGLLLEVVPRSPFQLWWMGAVAWYLLRVSASYVAVFVPNGPLSGMKVPLLSDRTTGLIYSVVCIDLVLLITLFAMATPHAQEVAPGSQHSHDPDLFHHPHSTACRRIRLPHLETRDAKLIGWYAGLELGPSLGRASVERVLLHLHQAGCR